MKWIRNILIVLVLLAVGLVAFLRYLGGATIKQAVNTGGPMALGVPVKLETAKLRPLAGHLHLGGLFVGNPEGFKTASLFELGQIEIDLEPRSLLSDTIRIKRIDIQNPKITMERGLRSSNLGALLEQLEQKQGEKSEAPAEKKAPPAEGGKKVVIDEITIAGAKLNVSLTAMGGFAAPIDLPSITLRDIGKEKEGARLTDVLTDIVRAILGSVTKVATSAGELVGDGAQLIGDGAAAVGGAAVDGATAVSGAAVDGVKAVGGAAADGVKAVGGAAAAAGGAVLDGAGSVLRGVGGLLGGGEKKED